MNYESFYIVKVKDPDSREEHKYLTMVPLELIQEKGLLPEAIVGEYFGLDNEQLELTSRTCKGNIVFKEFMQNCFSKYASKLPLCIEEAKQNEVNMLVLADLRNGDDGINIAEDVYGVMPVKGDAIGEYVANDRFLIFTEKGPLTLPPDLKRLLMDELNGFYDNK